MKLSDESCQPVKEGQRPITDDEAVELSRDLPRWAMRDSMIQREFKFKDFGKAIEFVNEIAEVAENQDHHPDICVFYNKVNLTLSTHKIGGLSRNDFILAAKIDELPLPN